MKAFLHIALVALSLPLCLCGCPNDCSGRGTCGPSSRCLCFEGLTGEDCSLRKCPTGRLWAGYAAAKDDLHSQVAECSNAGMCSRATGKCSCFEGFSGANCEQMQCPRDVDGTVCSGHGLCLSMRQAAQSYDGLRLLQPATTYDLWDADRIFGCVCDVGYAGYNCNLRTCVKGDDPETGDQVPEIQTVSCTCDGTCSGGITLTLLGKSKRILHSAVAKISDETGSRGSGQGRGESLEATLNALWPFPVVSDISYNAGTTLCSSGGTLATITYRKSLGDIAQILATSSGLTATIGAPSIGTATVQDATTDNAECSNRGICDTSTGLCSCFSNYTASDGDGSAGSIVDCGYNAAATASCPTTGGLVCAGHGSCSAATNFTCVCYAGYTGAACHMRQCPTGPAWFDEASEYNVAHGLAVCSNRGDCDSTSGACTCHAGYTGAACDRTVCPSSRDGLPCNGNGRCVSVRRLAELGRANGSRRGDADIQYLSCNITSGYFTLQLGYMMSATILPTFTAVEVLAALQSMPTIGIVEVTFRDNAAAVCSASPSVTAITFLSYGGNVPLLHADTTADAGGVIVTRHREGSLVSYGDDGGLSSTWDADMLHGCHCDGYPDYNKTFSTGDIGEWFGADCSLRSCPFGIDPVQEPGVYVTRAFEKQQLLCTGTSGWFQLGFRGHVTQRILTDDSLHEVKAKIEALPSVGVILVTADAGTTTICDGSGAVVDIEFQTELGDLPDLFVDDYDFDAGSVTVSTVTDGVGVPESCSGRGLCDTKTALCKCFKGFASSNGLGGRGRRGDCGAEMMEMLINP